MTHYSNLGIGLNIIQDKCLMSTSSSRMSRATMDYKKSN